MEDSIEYIKAIDFTAGKPEPDSTRIGVAEVVLTQPVGLCIDIGLYLDEHGVADLNIGAGTTPVHFLTPEARRRFAGEVERKLRELVPSAFDV